MQAMLVKVHKLCSEARMNGIGRPEVTEELCQVYGGLSLRKGSVRNQLAPGGLGSISGTPQGSGSAGGRVQRWRVPSAAPLLCAPSPVPEIIQSSPSTAACRLHLAQGMFSLAYLKYFQKYWSQYF